MLYFSCRMCNVVMTFLFYQINYLGLVNLQGRTRSVCVWRGERVSPTGGAGLGLDPEASEAQQGDGRQSGPISRPAERTLWSINRPGGIRKTV